MQVQLHARNDSAARLLAEAIQQRYPEARGLRWYANDEGFVYEFAPVHRLAPGDLAALERDLAILITRNRLEQRIDRSRIRALALHCQQNRGEQASEDNDQPIRAFNAPQLCGSWPNHDWPDDAVVHQHGNPAEICAGSPIAFAGEIGVCRLVKVEIVRSLEETGELVERIFGRIDPR